MRILLTVDPEIPVPPKLYGGIERIVNALSIELKSRGHTVALLAHGDSTAPVDTLIAWPGSTSHGLFDSVTNMLELRRAVRRLEPDIIHSFSRLLYLLSVLRSPVPRIMSFQRAPTPRTIHRSSRLAGPRLTFTGCSEFICREGRPAGGTWHAIPNFVDLRRYTFVAAVPSDAPLVFLSRVEAIKGAHIAIAVAKRECRRLVIAGNHASTGEEGQYWREQIEPEIGRNGIEYVGPVDDLAKNALLGSAAALLVPVQWDEPFGIVFAESLACGTPVISCPRGALPEIVESGSEGYLAEEFESLCHGIRRVAEIDRSRCRRKAETFFSSQAVASQYEALYSRLIRQHRKAGDAASVDARFTKGVES